MDLRSQYSSKIIEAMKASSSLGHPVNPPIWWVDPTNRQAHAVNSGILVLLYFSSVDVEFCLF